MHRIDHATAAPGNLFTDGNPGSGVPATVVTPEWLNDLQENAMGVLSRGNIDPTKGRSADLADAVAAMAGLTAGQLADHLAALKAVPTAAGTNPNRMMTRGRAAVGDGFGADWLWKSAETRNESVEGRIVRPDDVSSGDPGRWVKTTGPWLGAHIREWGPPADGSAGCDTHWRAMHAWNAARGGGLVELADGTFQIRDPLPIETTNVLFSCIESHDKLHLRIHETATITGSKAVGATGGAPSTADPGYGGIHIRSEHDVTIEGHGWFDGGDPTTPGGLGIPILIRYRQDSDHAAAKNIGLDGLRFRKLRSSPVLSQFRPSRATLTGLAGGTPQRDDAVTGSLSGASAIVSGWDAGNNYLYFRQTGDVQFVDNDVLSGAGWSATMTSVSNWASPTVDGLRATDLWAEDLGGQGFGFAGTKRAYYAGLTSINTGLATSTLSIGLDLSVSSNDTVAHGFLLFDHPGGHFKVEARYGESTDVKSSRAAVSDVVAVSDLVKLKQTATGANDYSLAWPGLIESQSIISVVRERGGGRAYLAPNAFWSATGYGNPAGGVVTIHSFMTFTGAPAGGTPAAGDVIGNGLGATGVVVAWDGTTLTYKPTNDVSVHQFANGNTVGNGTWSATLNVLTAGVQAGDVFYVSRAVGYYAVRNTGHRVNMSGVIAVGAHGIGFSQITYPAWDDVGQTFRLSNSFIADVLPSANGNGNPYWFQTNYQKSPGRLDERGASIHDTVFANTSYAGVIRAGGVAVERSGFISCIGGTCQVQNNGNAAPADSGTYDHISYSYNRHFDCPVGAYFYDKSTSGSTAGTDGSQHLRIDHNLFLGALAGNALLTYGQRGGTKAGNIIDSSGTGILMATNWGYGVRHGQNWLKSGGTVNPPMFLSASDDFLVEGTYVENGTNPVSVVATVGYGWVGRITARNSSAQPTVDANVETDYLWFGKVTWTPGLLTNKGDTASATTTIPGAPAKAQVQVGRPGAGADFSLSAGMTSAGNAKVWASALTAGVTPPAGDYLLAARQMANP